MFESSYLLSLRGLDGVAELNVKSVYLFSLVSKARRAGQLQCAPRQELHCLARELAAASRAVAVVHRCHVFLHWRKATALCLPPEYFSNDEKLLTSFCIVSLKSFSYDSKVQDNTMVLPNRAQEGSFVNKIINFLCAKKIKFTIRTSFISSLSSYKYICFTVFPFNLSCH